MTPEPRQKRRRMLPPKQTKARRSRSLLRSPPRRSRTPTLKQARARGVLESPTTQPLTEGEPDGAAVAAEAGPSEELVGPAVEPATPEEAPTTPRRPPAPAWAWVAILLMALLLVSALTTLAVARNANPSTPEAVEDVQTLVVELEVLNGHLATTNQLMSDAITNAEFMSANVQANLAGMSAQLGDVEAGVGQARSLLGSQLSEATRSELGTAQEQLQFASGLSRRRAGGRGAAARSDQP